ncbi:MutS protein msh4 [Thecaphora frezii]
MRRLQLGPRSRTYPIVGGHIQDAAGHTSRDHPFRFSPPPPGTADSSATVSSSSFRIPGVVPSSLGDGKRRPGGSSASLRAFAPTNLAQSPPRRWDEEGSAGWTDLASGPEFSSATASADAGWASRGADGGPATLDAIGETDFGGRSTARPFTSSSYHHLRTTTADGSIGTYVCAVLEHRGVGREVGVAAIEKTTGRCVLTQFADTPTYVKTIHHLSLHPPSVILVPESAVRAPLGSGTKTTRRAKAKHAADAGEESVLVKCLEDVFDLKVVPLPRNRWNHEEGARYLDKLLVEDMKDRAREEPSTPQTPRHGSSLHEATTETHAETSRSTLTSEMTAAATTRAAILEAISSKYYALSAACALLEYVESVTNRIFSPHSLRIRYVVPDGTVLISSNTARDLELVNSLVDRQSKLCLYGLLDHCVTPMGQRLLRMNILQPLTDKDTIEARYDAVEECIQSEERFYAIKESLKPLKEASVDLDKVIHQLIATDKKMLYPKRTENKIAQMLSLRTLIRTLWPSECSQGNFNFSDLLSLPVRGVGG